MSVTQHENGMGSPEGHHCESCVEVLPDTYAKYAAVKT